MSRSRSRRDEGELLSVRLWDLLDAIHEIAGDEAEARATFAAILREGRAHVETSGPWLAFAREVSVAA
jgi:hypothetical protein